MDVARRSAVCFIRGVMLGFRRAYAHRVTLGRLGIAVLLGTQACTPKERTFGSTAQDDSTGTIAPSGPEDVAGSATATNGSAQGGETGSGQGGETATNLATGGRDEGSAAGGSGPNAGGAGGGVAPAPSPCLADPCVFGSCADNGDDFVCTCTPGYTGETCEETLTSCAAAECGNGACVETAEGPTCECELGWGGSGCDVELNECEEASCQNGGTCIDDLGSFSCDCAEGYSGDACQVNNDDCLVNPCLNGGTCIDGVNSFVCDCGSGFRGDTCDEAFTVCTADACQNGGTCADTESGPVCECLEGFTGTTCQINDNDCAPNPCLNGGTCEDGAAAFTCSCAQGWDGPTCSNNINDCAGNPCQNGGTCVDQVGNFACDCAAGFAGSTCQTNSNDCSPNPCQNGGSCQDGVDGFTCQCAAGFSGSTCSVNTNDCASNPCQNGGSCQDGVDSYTCQCPQGYSGNNCQTNVDDCSPGACQNGGTCIDLVNDYSCQCDGYLGENCELPMFETVAAPNGYEYCYVNGISGAGTHLVVSCLMSFMHTFRWSRSAGLQEVPFPPDTYTMTGAAIDSTGNNVFGYASVAGNPFDVGTAFRWSSSGVDYYAPYQAEGSVLVSDASADGSRLLGEQSGDPAGQLLLWSSMAAPTRYEPNPGDDRSFGGKISGNGQVVIGNSHDSNNSVSDLVRWTGPTTRQPISIAGTYFSVYDVNYDGQIAVGYSDGYTGQAWVWRSTSGVSQLPTLGGTCSANSVSDDGTRIVGTCQDGANSVAVLWEGNTVQRISTLLTNAGAELAGDTLRNGSAFISADGLTVAGGYGLAIWVGRFEN